MSSFKYDFSVIGGDMRQVFLTGMLAQPGIKLCYYALPAKPDLAVHSVSDSETAAFSSRNPADFGSAAHPASVALHEATSLEEACLHSRCIVCPFPFLKNETEISVKNTDFSLSVSDILPLLQPGQSFFAGGIPPFFRKKAEENSVFVFDYSNDESLPVYNSIATAEGAICEAILRSPLNLHKSRCAVLGFGRCGSSITSYLKGMFANVCVFTNTDEAQARASVTADNSCSLKDLLKHADEFDFIFNTIPAQLLTADILRAMKPHVLIIDIASSPGGIDYDAARKCKIAAVHCPGLPGKYAPASSARYLKDYINKKQQHAFSSRQINSSSPERSVIAHPKNQMNVHPIEIKRR